MHVEITYPRTVGLHACNNYYIYVIVILFFAVRFDSISVLDAVRPRALTPAPAHHHTQYGLSPFLTQPAHHNAVLTIRATYCLWLFLDLFLRLLHLHRIVCQSVPATPSLYYHSTKTHSIARAVKRCRFIHIPLEQTYSIPHFRISQTRHKLVTNSLLQTYNHTCKNAFSPLSVQTSSYSFNMNVCTTRLHTSTRVAIQFNIQPNNSIIASDNVH